MFVRHPWYDTFGRFHGISLDADPGAPSGGGTAAPPAPPPPASPPAGQPSEPFRTFKDQAEFDAEAAKIRRNAEREAEKKLAETLGVPVEEAKRILTERQEAETAKLSEVEKREQAAAKERQEAAAEKAEAARLSREAKIALALVTAGVRADRVQYATDAVTREIGDDADKITDAVTKVKGEVPEFFGGAPTSPTPSPNPSGGPRANGQQGHASGVEAGRARAKADFKNQAEAFRSPFEGMQLIGGPPAGGSR